MSADVPLLDLPDDPDLAVVARALELHGFAGEVWDASWRVAYLSSEHRTLVSAGRRRADVAGLGAHLLSAESIAARETWPTGADVRELPRVIAGLGQLCHVDNAGRAGRVA